MLSIKNMTDSIVNKEVFLDSITHKSIDHFQIGIMMALSHDDDGFDCST